MNKPSELVPGDGNGNGNGDENLYLRRMKSEESVVESLPSFEDFFRRSTSEGICEPTKQGLFKDLMQTQLALWTCTLSVMSTYCWQKRVRPRSFAVALIAFNIAVCLSAALFVLVLAAHLINANFFPAAISGGGSGDESSDFHRMRANSVCSYRSGSGRTSGYSTPEFKGQARFWQRRVSTERVYYGNVLRR